MIALLKEAFQNETLHDLIICRWHRAFTDGKKSSEVEQVGGRQRIVAMDVNINTVSVVIEEDCHSSIRMLADDLHILRMSIQCILTKELKMKPVSSIWALHFLRAEEMEHHRLLCSKNLLQISQDPDILFRVIAVDKFWIHHNNPPLNVSQRWGSMVANSG